MNAGFPFPLRSPGNTPSVRDQLQRQYSGPITLCNMIFRTGALMPSLPGAPAFRFLHLGFLVFSLQWRHDVHNSVSNHQPRHCLLNCSVSRRSKKISKLQATGLCAGNSPLTGEFPAQRASNAEKVSIWWRHLAVKMTQEKECILKLSC